MTDPGTPFGGETGTVHAALQVSGTGRILAVGDPSDASRTGLHRLEPPPRWTGRAESWLGRGRVPPPHPAGTSG